MGDAVNTTARLTATAKAGTVVISDVAAMASKMPLADLDRCELSLKGKRQMVTAWVSRPPQPDQIHSTV